MRRRRNNANDEDNGFAEWGGYMDAKKSKLYEQFEEQTKLDSDKVISNIFQGISIFVNGYTKPSAEELKRLMALHGGIYHHYESSKTTHIIASMLPDSKIRQLSPNDKIVKPSWITDSIAAGKLLDYKQYLLYTSQTKSQLKLTDVIRPESSNESRHMARTAVDPNFLSEFYNHSRLHLISSLGATFKQKVSELRECSDGKFFARQKLKDYVQYCGGISNGDDLTGQVIMHIDMDCFFVSVGLLKRPELKGKPIAVTHARADQSGPERPERQIEFEMYKERLKKKLNTQSDFVRQDIEIETKVDGISTNNSMSEIASCSYEARKMGVKNGMFLGTAMKICPNLVTIPYDFEEYKRIANILYDTIVCYTLDIEAVSCDEMYVDITELLASTGATVEQWASYIRKEIQEATGCPCSTGFGSNRLQARLATKAAKPNGQYILLADQVESYLFSIDVNSLPGVGRSLSYRLKALNLNTCGDLQKMTLSRLQTEFGDRTGKMLYDCCRGIDNKTLVYEHVRKSISAEVNYGIRFKNNTEAETFLIQLCGEVHTRLSDVKMKGKNISLKLLVRAKDAPVESSKFMGHGLCDCINKSSSLLTSTCDLEIIKREILSLWRKLNIPPEELRGIGIQISKLESNKISNKENPLIKLFKNNYLKSNQISTAISKQDVEEHINFENEKNISLEKVENLDQSSTKVTKETTKLQSINEVNIESGTQKKTNDIFSKQNKITSDTNRKGRKKKENESSQLTLVSTFKQPSKMNYKQETNTKIDEEFLNELPEELRQEVIREYNILPKLEKKTENYQQEKENVDNEFEVDEKVLSELPEDIRNEIIEQYNLNKKHTASNVVEPKSECSTKMNADILQTMTWKELKVLIDAWIRTQSNPEKIDVDIISNFAYNMAISRKIEILYDFVKFFCRLIASQTNCEWHRAYVIIVAKMQEGMLKTYKSKLATDKTYQCEKCNFQQNV